MVWRWRANSLVGGGEEVLSGDPIARRVAREEGSWFLGGPERLVLGADGTGNIRSSSNVARVRDECVAQIGRPWLVTADGSVDCSGAPGEQEDIVAPLLFCEAATALGVLAEGGCLVLKIFTFASPDMLSVLRLLSALFDEVLIAKPDSSRPGNSEAYAVCLGFRGLGALGGDADEVWSNLLRGVRDRGGVGGLHDLKRGLESWTLGEWGQGVLKAARGLWGAQCKAILCNIRLFTASCGGTAYSCLKSHRCFALKHALLSVSLLVPPFKFHEKCDGCQLLVFVHRVWHDRVWTNSCAAPEPTIGTRADARDPSWHKRSVQNFN